MINNSEENNDCWCRPEVKDLIQLLARLSIRENVIVEERMNVNEC